MATVGTFFSFALPFALNQVALLSFDLFVFVGPFRVSPFWFLFDFSLFVFARLGFALFVRLFHFWALDDRKLGGSTCETPEKFGEKFRTMATVGHIF